MGSQLLSKFEWRLHETCKTLRRRIAAKFRMRLIGSLIKINRISEVLMHVRFFENFTKSWKISLISYKTCKKFKQFQPGYTTNGGVLFAVSTMITLIHESHESKFKFFKTDVFFAFSQYLASFVRSNMGLFFNSIKDFSIPSQSQLNSCNLSLMFAIDGIWATQFSNFILFLPIFENHFLFLLFPNDWFVTVLSSLERLTLICEELTRL